MTIIDKNTDMMLFTFFPDLFSNSIQPKNLALAVNHALSSMSMAPEPIKALVLDLGEVLIRLDFSSVMELLGLGKPTLGAALQAMDKWEIYDAFERGKVTEEVFITEALRKLGLQLSPEEFRVRWNSVLKETVPGVEKLIPSLACKLPLFALTNSNETHIRHARQHYPWLSHFHHIYTSFELQARKPEPVIFHRLSHAIGVEPESILFIDDRVENVEGARLAGLVARCCLSSPADLQSILAEFHLL